MQDFILKLVEDFNIYSQLVALNLEDIKTGKYDEGTLQWNRGNLERIREYLKILAEKENATLNWETSKHPWQEVTYMRVSVTFN